MKKLLTSLVILVWLFAHAASADAGIHFKHLSMKDGMSGNRIFDVFQDKQGYIWLATDNGLDRYDGYSFKVFTHDPGDPNSIAGNTVKALYQDPQGNIWIGLFGGGLDEYDNGAFHHHRHASGDANSLISDNVWSLNGTKDGQLLIGTFDSGLDTYDPKSGRFKHYPASQDNVSPSDNRINGIMVDPHGAAWLETESGLNKFDPGGKIPTRRLDRAGTREANIIWGAAEDKQSRIWLVTQSGPTIYLEGATKLSDRIPVADIPESLAKNNLRSTFVDSRGNVWFGSGESGLYLLQANGEIENFQQLSNNPDGLSSDTVWDIYEDRSGYLWIATDAGINLLDLNSLAIHTFRPLNLDSQRSASSDKVVALLEYHSAILLGSTAGVYQIPLDDSGDPDESKAKVFLHLDLDKFGGVTSLSSTSDGDLLVGTLLGYLLDVDQGGRIKHAWLTQRDPAGKKTQINSIVVASDKKIFLGKFGAGLVKFNPMTNSIDTLGGAGPSELDATENVETMLQATDGSLWVGTFRGLFRANPDTGKTALIPMLPGGNEPVVQGLYLDEDANLWIGTLDGLWKLHLDSNGNPTSSPVSIQSFRRTAVLSIESDDYGDLWLATLNSLVRYDPKTEATLTYGPNQGSLISEYYSYGHLHTHAGWMWFGGGQGAIGFLPQDLKPNIHPPDVVLDSVTAYREGEPDKILLSDGAPLTLTYKDAISIFDVAAMDFGAPQANTYSYRLLGFQSEWTPPNASHQITFTNLNPGRYRLEVKAANNWGIWSAAPAALDITVLPPWWRTWWAYTLYLLIIIGSSIGYVYSLKRKIEREREISDNLREANEIKSNFVERLESQVRKATHELRETLQGVNLKNAELEIAQKRATEAEQVKSQFLANMSHELRTPLTGVLGYTKLLGSTHLNSEQKDYVSTIKQSSETLLAIINDTLDLSRLEAGKLLIDQVDFDLLEVIESTLELLAPTAYQKRLELVRVVPADIPLYLRGDPLRLRQVLTNLLSNAIKFTEHGSVAIEVKALAHDERETKLAFTISDTGIGIPAGELSKLFHAYARSRISTQHHVEGTGLGLAICKKLLDLMGGDIKVASKVGTGTSFEFELAFKLQKNAEPRSRLPRKIKILLYDAHPLSNQAWQACLMRLGADVETAPNLESVVSIKADAAVMVLSEKELTQLGELKRTLTPVLPPMLILAPRIERQALKDLSETLFHRVLSKTAREKTLYLELQSLLQTVVQDIGTTSRPTPTTVEPAADAPKILVADDNRINRRLLVTMLNHAGFRVAEAANGLELLDLSAKGPWDAALLDIHMPGMDGIEAAKRLRETLGDKLPPIIAMSADVMPETRNQVLEGIMDDFMVKPFSEQELVDKLRWHLDRHHRKKRTTPQDA